MTDWNSLPESARYWMKELGNFGPTARAEAKEVKGCMHDPDEGGTVKTYLDSGDLRAIANACREVADWLDRRAAALSGERGEG